MIGYLVDTNIPSELTRPKPEHRVASFLKEVGKDRVYISVLTLGEICKGIAGIPAGARRAQLQEWLDTIMRPWFAGRVLPVTDSVAERWGLMAGEAKLRGVALSVVDGLLAATALEHDLALVTRNAKDFSGLGLRLLNPWQGT